MKFSILIPVYNVEKYIRECLDSVMCQTYQDFEVILVDDGSTDSSGQICDEYKKRYPEQIKVIHKENQGLISARRVGIKNAKGEFCVFVDSDDSVEPELLNTLATYLSSDIKIDILLYSFRYFRDGIKAERHPVFAPDGTVWRGAQKQELYEKLVFTNEITSIWTKAIRTEILQHDPTQYERYYKKNMAEDLLQSLYPLTEARSVCYTDKVLYNYRINSESISHNYSLNNVVKNDTSHVYHEVKKYLARWRMDSEEYQKRLDAEWFHKVMYQFVRCYENSSGGEEHRHIMEFEWDQLLPDVSTENNEFVSTVYLKIYQNLRKKRFFAIRFHFIMKGVSRGLRRLKRRILK